MPFEVLAPVLMDSSARWLKYLEAPDASDHAVTKVANVLPPDETGGNVTIVVRVGPGAKHSGPPVIVTAGSPRLREQNVTIPIHWEPISFEHLLPRLDADLELSDLGGSVTRLAVSGRYRVPLGQLGWGIDRLAMHRVAESSLRHFLHDIQEAVLVGR